MPGLNKIKKTLLELCAERGMIAGNARFHREMKYSINKLGLKRMRMEYIS